MTAPFKSQPLSPAVYSLVVKQTQQPFELLLLIVKHVSSCSTIMRRQRQIPAPQSSRLRIKAFPHPHRYKMQLWLLLSGKNPWELCAALCFWLFCVMYACYVGGMLWVLQQKYITRQPAWVTGSYAHWHVAFEKEKPTLWDLTSKLGMKHQKIQMYKHLRSCYLQ